MWTDPERISLWPQRICRVFGLSAADVRPLWNCLFVIILLRKSHDTATKNRQNNRELRFYEICCRLRRHTLYETSATDFFVAFSIAFDLLTVVVCSRCSVIKTLQLFHTKNQHFANSANDANLL